jgi:hypothetical protein
MTLVCKESDSNILLKKQISERWHQYFKELLSPVTTRINNTNIHEGPVGAWKPQNQN